jgi:hypothetical protein
VLLKEIFAHILTSFIASYYLSNTLQYNLSPFRTGPDISPSHLITVLVTAFMISRGLCFTDPGLTRRRVDARHANHVQPMRL